jgi:hypothetical protein
LDDRPQSTDEILRVDDMIVTVCDSADQLMARAHLHWSVQDPVRVGTPRAFEAALEDITRRIVSWVGPELEGH